MDGTQTHRTDCQQIVVPIPALVTGQVPGEGRQHSISRCAAQALLHLTTGASAYQAISWLELSMDMKREAPVGNSSVSPGRWSGHRGGALAGAMAAAKHTGVLPSAYGKH
jgi:hypothetical protein